MKNKKQGVPQLKNKKGKNTFILKIGNFTFKSKTHMIIPAITGA